MDLEKPDRSKKFDIQAYIETEKIKKASIKEKI